MCRRRINESIIQIDEMPRRQGDCLTRDRADDNKIISDRRNFVREHKNVRIKIIAHLDAIANGKLVHTLWKARFEL